MVVTDGGSDHWLTYVSVKLSYLALFLYLNLGMLVAVRTCPHQSWSNLAVLKLDVERYRYFVLWVTEYLFNVSTYIQNYQNNAHPLHHNYYIILIIIAQS